MRILGLPGDAGACAYYRIEKPLQALQEAGLAEVHLAPIVDGNRYVRVGEVTEQDRVDAKQKHGDMGAARVIAQLQNMPDAAEYDLLLLQRQPELEAGRLIGLAQAAGTRVAFDIDDNAYNVPYTNPQYLTWGRDARKVRTHFVAHRATGEMPHGYDGMTEDEAVELAVTTRRQLIRNMGMADLLTVTTPHLRDLYRQLNEVAILPNQMTPQDWEELKPIAHDGVWIGWAGSRTHLDDLKVIARPMMRVLEQIPEAKLVVIGFPEAREAAFADLPSDRLLIHDWMPINEYRNYLASLDIILAPSADNDFNRGKSDIRVLEAGMCGRPVVASKTTYGPTVKESGGGFIARKPRDWARRTVALAKDPGLREKMGGRLREYVLGSRTYAANAAAWHDTYERLLNGTGP